jgi:prephenate dehydratase
MSISKKFFIGSTCDSFFEAKMKIIGAVVKKIEVHIAIWTEIIVGTGQFRFICSQKGGLQTGPNRLAKSGDSPFYMTSSTKKALTRRAFVRYKRILHREQVA